MSINIFNKVRKLAKAFLPFYLFTLLPLFAACADTWDDHYEKKGDDLNDASIWQAITENGNLSNFAKVVARSLQSSHPPMSNSLHKRPRNSSPAITQRKAR